MELVSKKIRAVRSLNAHQIYLLNVLMDYVYRLSLLVKHSSSLKTLVNVLVKVNIIFHVLMELV